MLQDAHRSTRRELVVTELRRSYFANASETASRYAIDFDRVVAHLWRARGHYQRLVVRSVVHLDDLVHAIACIDQIDLAWSDLSERYERALRRCCLVRLSETDSLLLVRRLLRSMRYATRTHDAFAPNLEHYTGIRPLRDWLAQHVVLGLRAVERAEQMKAEE